MADSCSGQHREGDRVTKKTIKKLKAGKYYYVQIRSIHKVRNPATGKTRTIYGKWSVAKRFKAKK